MTLPKMTLITPIAVMLVSVLVLLGSLVYSFKLSERIEVSYGTLQTGKQDLAVLDQALVDYTTHYDSMLKINQTLPHSYQEIVGFTRDLDNLAVLKNVKIEQSLDPDTLPEQSGLISLKNSLTLTGSYQNLIGFFTGLVHLPYHTRFDVIQMDPGDGGLTAKVDVRLFMTPITETQQ